MTNRSYPFYVSRTGRIKEIKTARRKAGSKIHFYKMIEEANRPTQ